MNWNDINNQVSTATTATWDEQSQLATQLDHLVPHLDRNQCQLLVGFAHDGVPLILTWDSPLSDTTVERTTSAVIVQSVTAPTPTRPGRVRLADAVLTHEIHLTQVVDVQTYERTIATHHLAAD